MQQLIIALGTTETKVFDSAGAYFEIIDSTGAISVNFYDRNGSRTKDLELNAVLSGTYVSGPFVRFEITNTYGVAQNVTILYGAGNGGSRRSPGTVRVIDQSKDLTLAGGQYLGSVATQQTANFSVCGIRANVKNVIVKRAYVAAAAAGMVSIWGCSGDVTANPSNYASALASKLVGAGGGDARGLRGLAAAANPTGIELPGGVALAQVYVAANVTQEIFLSSPIYLRPGYGLVAVGPGLAILTTFTIDAEES